MNGSLKNKLAVLFWNNLGHMFTVKKSKMQIPDFLYHYTNIDGMMGIIKKKEFWMTKSDFLNDSNEIIYLKQLEEETIAKFEKNMIEKRGEDIVKDQIYIEFIIQFKIALNLRFDKVDDLIEIYVLSLSEKKDSLVLWSNYAKGDGYNIGFDAKALVKEFKDENEDFTIVSSRIVYDKVEQIKIIATSLSSAFESVSNFGERKEELKTELPLFFKSILITHSIFFKHEAFKAEEEFRIAATISDKALVNFRSNQGNIIPYISPLFTELPIREVVIGPKNNSDIAKEGIKVYLDRCGYELNEISVEKSQVPLRY